MKASQILNLNLPERISVVGCGGKTTFIEQLAEEYKHKKVLITPTTKIKIPENSFIYKTIEECENHKAINGIQYFGIIEKTKLKSLPLEFLEKIISDYDLVLMEADGSAGLPAKGWNETEPVIPNFSTHTIGIITLDALGKIADETTVLRLNEFEALTQIKKGQKITIKAIQKMISSNGMFKSSVGNKSLFVNKINQTEITKLEQLKSDMQMAYGNALENSWEEL